MTSTLLLLQFAAQNIGLFCCALFAGAATYVSLVGHPAMDEGAMGLGDASVRAAHPKPAIFQAFLGVIGALRAMLAGAAGGAMWWLAGGMFLGAAASLQVFAVLPLTRRLAGIEPRADPKNAARMMARLAKLHAALSLAALAALFMLITKA